MNMRKKTIGMIAVLAALPFASASTNAKPLPEDARVLTGKLARILGARVGDGITVKAMEGRRPVRRVVVSAITHTYLGLAANMPIGALNRFMFEGPTVSGAYLMVDPARTRALYRALKNIPAIASVTLRRAALDTFRRTLKETMLTMVLFFIAFAGIIAIGVVYNAARITLSERARELASLRVLGFTRAEVS